MLPPLNDFGGPNDLNDTLERALASGLFFVRRDHRLLFLPPKEETITWEIFRGQLLDSRHTREQQTFLSYHVEIKDSEGTQAPLLTFRVSLSIPPGPAHAIHVTRWLLLRIWEAFDDNGAIGSRETERWVEELVGTVSLAEFNDVDSLLREIRPLVFHAFVGLSRLPLNSVEAPLPAFSLGIVGFFPSMREANDWVRDPIALLDRPANGRISAVEESKLLELFLRTASPVVLREGAPELARRLRERGETEAALASRLRKLFNEVSLTPYTDFVEKALTFTALLFAQHALSLEAYGGFLLGQIRQTVYHLTAYDLVTFHHQGANYPDALLLDALLREVLALASNHPGLLMVDLESDPRAVSNTRRRRRALVLGWWIHRFLHGLSVPDEPTSPGENARVLPAPHQRVPDEQLQPRGRRTRRLFADQPIDWTSHQSLLQGCLEELAHPEMLLELGKALYLDRPFGGAKPPAALDLTPLLSYELFSRSVARDRLNRIGQLEPMVATNPLLSEALARLEELQHSGVKVPPPVGSARTLHLHDCWRAADDFVILRPTPETMRQLRTLFKWEDCPGVLREWPEQGMLPIPVPGSTPQEATRIVFYDASFNPQFECTVFAAQGFRRLGALELPMPGLETTLLGTHVVIASQFP